MPAVGYNAPHTRDELRESGARTGVDEDDGAEWCSLLVSNGRSVALAAMAAAAGETRAGRERRDLLGSTRRAGSACPASATSRGQTTAAPQGRLAR
jgi:hypothetical protein